MTKYKHLITVREYAESEGVSLDNRQARILGQDVFNLYQNKYGKTSKPTVITRKGNKAKGYNLESDRDILEYALGVLVQPDDYSERS